jgi:type IV secretory pathway TrbD component
MGGDSQQMMRSRNKAARALFVKHSYLAPSSGLALWFLALAR